MVIGIALILMISPVISADVGGNIGYYLVQTNVDGAEVYFDEDYKGNTTQGALLVPVYVTGTPYKVFSVEKTGYFPYSGPIVQVPGAGETVNLYATLTLADPVAAKGIINVVCNPPNGSILLDKKPAGTVAPSGVAVLWDVPYGNHLLEVQLAGYQPYASSVYVAPNDIVKVMITLVPIPDGSLGISSVPAGAQVSVDNQYRGISPLTLNGFAAGSHTVTLTSPGYQDWSTTVQVNPGATTQVNANLAPIAPPATATSAATAPFVVYAALAGAGIVLLKRRG
jgi:PEGA domain